MPELIAAFSLLDWETRDQSAQALGKIGPAAKDAIPELDRVARNDIVGPVRTSAREALERIRK